MYPWSGLRQAPQVLSDWHFLCRIYSDVCMVIYSIKFPHIFRAGIGLTQETKVVKLFFIGQDIFTFHKLGIILFYYWNFIHCLTMKISLASNIGRVHLDWTDVQNSC